MGARDCVRGSGGDVRFDREGREYGTCDLEGVRVDAIVGVGTMSEW